MIHVGNRQDHLAARLRVRLTIVGAAIWVLWRAFTAVRRAEKDERPKRFPGSRMDAAAGVSLCFFWADWHGERPLS